MASDIDPKMGPPGGPAGMIVRLTHACVGVARTLRRAGGAIGWRRTVRPANIGFVFAAIIGASLAVPAALGRSTNAPGAVIFKSPFSANVFIGGPPVNLSEHVAGADRGIAAFELHLRFDPTVVRLSVAPGPLLAENARAVACQVIPIAPGEFGYSCVSSGAGEPSAGPGVLAYITVQPAEDLRIRPTTNNGVGTVVDDVLSDTRLLDNAGTKILVGDVTDANLLVRALEGDLNGDCRINIIDEQDIAMRYASFFGLLTYDYFHDLEPSFGPDGDIDVKDLQFVFGRNGSTCENPQPAQPTPTPLRTPSTPIVVTRTPVGTQTALRTETVTIPPRTATPRPTATRATTATPDRTATITVAPGAASPASGSSASDTRTPGPDATTTPGAAGATETISGTVTPTATARARSVTGLPRTGGGGALRRGGFAALLIAAFLLFAVWAMRRSSRDRG